jgi:peptidoglycan hydrolase-like protein with peptidoglycan-binding domain
MTRWTFVALAVTLSACNKGERDQPSQNASTTTAADSTMSATTTSADTSAAATVAPKKAATKPSKSDTAATARATAAVKTGAPTTGPTGAEAMMGRGPNAPPQQLTKEQIKQLQTALKKQGCYSGTPDGVSGPGTQHAIECGLEKYKLTPYDMSGLYRKLGLKF